MACDADIIRTTDICDDFADELLVRELAFNDYTGRDAIIVLTRSVHDS